MKYSCLWYSKVLAQAIRKEVLLRYLAMLEYGNQDFGAEPCFLTQGNPVWIKSSLKISPRQQAACIQKMVSGKLPVSSHAIEMTRSILFIEELPGGWKLFGKTGWSGRIQEPGKDPFEIGWFVGWVEKNRQFFPFAYTLCEEKIDLKQRIPRVKQLLGESKLNRAHFAVFEARYAF
jgi:beta-lactamase class D